MITRLIQALVADFMSQVAAPAVARAVARVVPATYATTVLEVVDQLFNPGSACFAERSQKMRLAAPTTAMVKVTNDQVREDRP